MNDLIENEEGLFMNAISSGFCAKEYNKYVTGLKEIEHSKFKEFMSLFNNAEVKPVKLKDYLKAFNIWRLSNE
jgi:hypothetical protein